MLTRTHVTIGAAALMVALTVPSLDGVLTADQDTGGAFTFALIGDMPYGAEGELKFPNVIADINADRSLSFVVHDGDIKNGSSLCSDEMFVNRLDLFNQFARPLIYVPGDNEWTDCHRANNGATIRSSGSPFCARCSFRPTRALASSTMTLERQSDDPAFALYPRERALDR